MSDTPPTGEPVKVTILAVVCGHPHECIRVIDNAVHEDVEHGARNTPLLLWCSRCGALAWTSGGLVALCGLGAVPPGPSAWLHPYLPR